MASQYWFHASGAGIATTFFGVNDSLLFNNNELIAKTLVPASGTLKGIWVWLSTAPGAGTSRRFQASINGGLSTILDITISNTSTSGFAIGNESLAAGDFLSIKCTVSGTVAATNLVIALEFAPSTANYYAYPCVQASGVGTQTSVSYQPALTGHTAAEATESIVSRSVMPFAGTIRAIYAAASAAPGSGKSISFEVSKNGSPLGSAAVISNTATSASQTGLSLHCDAGDYLTMVMTPSSTPAASRKYYGLVIEPDTAGLFLTCGNISSNLTSNWFYSPVGSPANAAASEVLGAAMLIAPVALKIKALALLLATAPGGATSRSFVSRINSSDGTLTASISGAATNSLVTGTDSLSANDPFSLVARVSGAAAASAASWSIALSATATLNFSQTGNVGLVVGVASPMAVTRAQTGNVGLVVGVSAEVVISQTLSTGGPWRSATFTPHGVAVQPRRILAEPRGAKPTPRGPQYRPRRLS